MPGVTRSVLVSLGLFLGTGCAVAGALPPSRTDIGTTVIAGDGEMSSGFRFSTGAHLASGVKRRDFPVDVGAGYVYERLARSPGSANREMSEGARPRKEPVAADGADDLHGGYLDVAYTISRDRGHRSWLGARGELLMQSGLDENSRVAGAYARVAWEIFKPSEGAFGGFSDGFGGGVGVSSGSAGLGLFLEAGAQRGEDDHSAFVATAGLCVRMPFLAGVFFDLCPRC